MNAIQEVKDEAIRKVAQTLRSSGLASSETEAVRMAIMMSKTSQRVTQNFDQKKQGATIGAHFSHVEEKKEEEEYPQINNAFGSARKVQEVHVQTPFSVQEKPSKIEEKEEFIFGDIQEEKSAQKKDPFNAESEFEEVIPQEVIETKAKPVVKQPEIHKAFGQPSVPREHVQEGQAPVHEKPSVPVQRPIDSTHAPLSAQSSAQMAFASLLGSAQKTQTHNQEAKPVVAHPSPVQTISENKQAAQPALKQTETAQHPQSMAQQTQPARVVMTHAPDPRANMMKEANVDLSSMFNVNK